MSEQEVVGFSDAEISALVQSGGELPQEQVEQQDNADQDHEGTEPTESHQDDTEQEQPQDDGKPIPRANKRFMQLTEQKRQLEAQNMELQNQLLRAQIEAENLRKFNEAVTKGKQEPEEEVLDEVLQKQTNQQIDALKKQVAETEYAARMNQERMVAAQSVPDFSEAEAYFIAAKAMEAINIAEAGGHKVTDEQALDFVSKQLDVQKKELAAANKNVGAIANFVYNQAKFYGYKPKSSNQAQPEIDMKAVQKARDTAGAPNIQRQAVTPNMGDWQSTVADFAKEDGISAKRLKGWM